MGVFQVNLAFIRVILDDDEVKEHPHYRFRSSVFMREANVEREIVFVADSYKVY